MVGARKKPALKLGPNGLWAVRGFFRTVFSRPLQEPGTETSRASFAKENSECSRVGKDVVPADGIPRGHIHSLGEGVPSLFFMRSRTAAERFPGWLVTNGA